MQNMIKISFTKQEWMAIGFKSHWLTAGIPMVRLDIDEIIKRIGSLGWTIIPLKDKAHYKFISPLKDYSTTVSVHNYDNNPHTWQMVSKSFIRYSPDLRFVFKNPFIIPYNFNKLTQKIESPHEIIPSEKTVRFRSLPELANDFLIRYENQWKKPADIDYSRNQILFEDNTIMTLNNSSSPVVTKQIASSYRMVRISRVIYR